LFCPAGVGQVQEKYSAAHIANFFIEKSMQEGIGDMTPMKVQKLAYMAQGWALAMLDIDIIGGEDIQAWQHGPVITSLYHSLKHYKSMPVQNLIEEDLSIDGVNKSGTCSEIPQIPASDTSLIQLLNAIWENYRDYTPSELRELTHRHDAPWSMHYKEGEHNTIIAKESIKAFYEILQDKVKARG
jgi:uncharacterized phage-associated protein